MAGRTLEFVGHDVTFDKSDATKCLVSSPAYNFNGSVLQVALGNIYTLNAEGTAFVWTDEAVQLPELGTWFTTSLSDGVRLAEIPLPVVPQSTDAIQLVRTAPASGPQPVYDLTGRRVGSLSADETLQSLHLRPGVYVVGGKKQIFQ